MRRLLFVIIGLLFLSTSSVFAQNKWADEGLKGYVMSMKQRCYEARTAPDGSVQKRDLTVCMAGNNDYLFDPKGRCKQVTGFDRFNAQDWIANYTYEKDGTKSEVKIESPTGAFRNRTEYRYDSNGNVAEELSYNMQGDLLERIAHNYNANNYKISTFCYKVDGTLRWRENYEYDQFGNRVGYKHYDAVGKLDWQTVYKNDQYGNKIEEGNYDADGNELSHTL